MVQHSILQWSMVVVLTVQVLADHLDVSLLTHLFWRLHAKTDVASRMGSLTRRYAHIYLQKYV